MDIQKKVAFVSLTLLAFFELTKTTGFCKFARMFPNQKKNTNFEGTTLHDNKDRHTDLPQFTPNRVTNISLAPIPGSSPLPTLMVSSSTRRDTTTTLVQSTKSKILPRTDADRQTDLPQFTTDRFTNSSLAPTTASSPLPKLMVSRSTKRDTTTTLVQSTKSKILPITDAACPEWTENSGSLYCVISERRNWEEATQICQSYSSQTHLVYIESAAENAFLTNFFSQKRLGNLNDAWIGLNDRKQEGDWKWGEKKEMVYSNWSDDYNEPNGNERSDQDCAFISTYFNGEWVD